MKLPYFLSVCICILLVTIFRFPAQMLDSAASAFGLWFQAVLPSLFPFLVACSLLMHMGIAAKCSKLFAPIMRPLFGLSGTCAFPFVLGLLAGYPVGAKMTAQLYEQKQISLSEAQKLLNFCNNPGPLFVVATVGTGFFHTPFWGYVMLCSIALGSVCTGICFRFQKSTPLLISSASIPYTTKVPFGFMLSSAIRDALLTTAQIGGFLAFFSVCNTAMQLCGIYQLLSHLLFFLPVSETFLQGICSGLLEMTNGAHILSTAPDGVLLCLCACVVLLTLGGLSILGQTLGVLQNVPFSIKRYLTAKLCHAAFALMIFRLLYPICAIYAKKAVPVFAPDTVTAFPACFSIFAIFLMLYTAWSYWVR